MLQPRVVTKGSLRAVWQDVPYVQMGLAWSVVTAAQPSPLDFNSSTILEGITESSLCVATWASTPAAAPALLPPGVGEDPSTSQICLLQLQGPVQCQSARQNQWSPVLLLLIIAILCKADACTPFEGMWSSSSTSLAKYCLSCSVAGARALEPHSRDNFL